MRQMKTKIYSLQEPNGRIRYIGKTKLSLKERLYAHIADAKYGKNKNRRCNWIRSLLSKRLFPKIILIEEVDGTGDYEETVWIKFYKEYGLDLVNGTDGGVGFNGLSEESYDKRYDPRPQCDEIEPVLPCTRHSNRWEWYDKGKENKPCTRHRCKMICLWCKTEFKPSKKNQKFCKQACKDAWHNWEKTHGMLIPECFRQGTQELADGQGKTLKEMTAIVYAAGLKWEEQGRTLTDEQIFGGTT